jgi:pimeloyl-ACP methyl ester carboxylesterase
MLTCQLISGFTQTQEQWNGVQELREKLLSELDDYSSLSVRVRLDTWNANWYEIARQLYMLRERYPEEPFVVVVFAYSWGCGHGLVKLAKYLDRFGVDIQKAVLSDPVYRHWFLKWRALMGDARIRVPNNVLSMEGFYQTTDKPAGRLPVSDLIKCEPWTKLRLPHAEMDDARAWRLRCVEVAKEQALLAVGAPSNVPARAPVSVATVGMQRTESSLAAPREGDVKP